MNSNSVGKMSLIIRRGIAITFSVVYLGVGLLTASYPTYIQTFQAMSIPITIILGAYFGGNLIQKHNKTDKDND